MTIRQPRAHADSAALDAALIAGEPSIRELTEIFALSDACVRRHRANHLSADILQGPRLGEGVTPGYLLESIVAVLIDAMRVRESAVLANKPDLVLRAGKEVRTTVELMLNELGVDDGEMAEYITLQEQLSRAVISVIREVPKVGEVVADRLELHGHAVNARDIRDFAARAALALEEKK